MSPCGAGRIGGVEARASVAQDELAGLLARVARRDRAAFRDLHGRAGPKLFGAALRICRDRGLAEEAWQEALIDIWRKADAYDPARGEAISWMAAIARHRALDLVRRRGRGPVSVEDDTLEILLEAARVDGPDHAERDALSRCLDALEERPRAAVLLAYVEGWSREELAARYDAPVNTVKTWLRRALLSLRGCMEGR